MRHGSPSLQLRYWLRIYRFTALAVILVLSGCVAWPGVQFTSGAIEKVQLRKVGGFGRIESLKTGEFGTFDNEVIAVVAEHGLAFVSPTGAILRETAFDRKVANATIFRAEPGGVFKIMEQGYGWSPVSVLSIMGKTEWTYPQSNGRTDSPLVRRMVAAKVADKAESYFVLGLSNEDEILILDGSGQEIRRIDSGRNFDLWAYDYDGDGSDEIFYGDANDNVQIIDLYGSTVESIHEVGATFSPIIDARFSPKPFLVSFDGEGKLGIFSLAGEETLRFPFPRFGHARAEGVVAYLSGPENDPFFAFARTIKANGELSELSVFDSRGGLLYREIFRAPFLSVTALTSSKGLQDRLLVSSNDAILQYQLVDQLP